MTVEEIIDQALAQGDNVSPTSADYLERRRLALSALRETVNEVWWARDWPFKRKGPVTVTVPALVGYVDLPVDFNSLGVFGRVFTDLGDPLDEVPESVIMDFNAETSSNSTNPRYFALHGQDETNYLGYITIPRNSGAQSLQLFYQSNPPVLLDAGDTDGYGTISSVGLAYSAATGLVTATATDHGFESGQTVTIAGAVESGYNGDWVVTVTGPNTFTYVYTATPSATPATGTITATRTVSVGNRAVLRIPSRYHQSILTWGVRAKLRESKGDARFQYAQGEYVKGLKAAMVEEAREQTRRDGSKQLPSFFGGSRGAY